MYIYVYKTSYSKYIYIYMDVYGNRKFGNRMIDLEWERDILKKKKHDGILVVYECDIGGIGINKYK